MVELGQASRPPRSRAEALARIDADLEALDDELACATLVVGRDEDGGPVFGVPERHLEAVMAVLAERIEADRRTLEAQRAIVADAAAGEAGAKVGSAAAGRSLAALSALWVAHRSPAPSSQADMRTAISRFERVNGRLAYGEVTDEHARRLKDDLLADRGLKNATRQKLWGLLRAMFGAARDDALLASNPFSNVKLPHKDDSAPREVLTRDDLVAFFGALGVGSEEWWIARVALYTGARLGEVVQLTKADLETVGGVPVLGIRPDAEAGRTVKTRSSIRKVPVHRQLVADGFLEWARGRPGEALFGLASQAASKRLNRRMRAAGLGPGKVVHSLRHTFKGVARRHMAQEWHDRLTGHAARSVGQGYGDYELGALKERVDRVAFGIEAERAGAA
jgi:integrase